MIKLRTCEVLADSVETQKLRAKFDQRHCLRLTGLLDDSLLELLRPRLDRGQWTHRQHHDIGKELVLQDNYALNLLHFAVNAPAFLGAIASLTGCEDIKRFRGRIYRMEPNSDHYDTWHDDLSEDRLVGMSVNLSFDGYEGGEFELREREAPGRAAKIAPRFAGDAVLFRIDPGIEHRVAPLAGNHPRTAFAGWFRSGKPDPVNELAQSAAARRESSA